MNWIIVLDGVCWGLVYYILCKCILILETHIHLSFGIITFPAFFALKCFFFPSRFAQLVSDRFSHTFIAGRSSKTFIMWFNFALLTSRTRLTKRSWTSFCHSCSHWILENQTRWWKCCRCSWIQTLTNCGLMTWWIYGKHIIIHLGTWTFGIWWQQQLQVQ